MSNFTQLKEDDRRKIDALINDSDHKTTLKDIAKVIGCHRHTIEREIRLGKTEGSKYLNVREYCKEHELKYLKGGYFYRWNEAEKKSEARKANSHKWKKIESNPELEGRIRHALIEMHWKPDVIAGWMRVKMQLERKDRVCCETIYTFIYQKGNEELKECLGTGNKKPHKERGMSKQKKTIIPYRTSIRERDEIVGTKQEFGHYEADSVVSMNHSSGEALNTIIEMKSRKMFVTKLKRKTAANTIECMLAVFRKIPSFARKTVTFDNGSEFVCHHRLKEELGMETYFADPYSSYQRGSNERHNGLIRRHYPKKTDFKNVSEKDLEETVNYFNNLPRKILGYKTPNEVWAEEIAWRCKEGKNFQQGLGKNF